MGIGALKNAAVFLDRDGVINENVFYEATGEWEAPLYPVDFRLLPGVIEALQELQKRFLLILVSNQPAFAKGKTTLESIFGVQDRLQAALAAADIQLTEACYSYSHPDGIEPGFSGPSLERKPGTYFLRLAAARHGIDLTRSWMIGDRVTDIECGLTAGTRAILVGEKSDQKSTDGPERHFTVKDLTQAAALILKQAG